MNGNPYKPAPELQDSRPGSNLPKTRTLGVLAVIVIVVVLIGLLLPATRSARPAAYRMSCANNLKQIALALQNYEATYHSFPPAATFDSSGNPLHSWRTLILPFLEQNSLYESIDLSKPWDDLVNAKAYAASVPAYHCPSLDSRSPVGNTTYLGVVAPHGFFLPSGSRRLSEIIDSPSETLMVVEVPSVNSVHWMQPVDASELTVLSMRENAKLHHGKGFQAAFVDGSIQFLGQDLSQEDRRAIISIAGDDSALKGSKL